MNPTNYAETKALRAIRVSEDEDEMRNAIRVASEWANRAHQNAKCWDRSRAEETRRIFEVLQRLVAQVSK